MRAIEFISEITGRRGFLKGAGAAVAGIASKSPVTKIVTTLAKKVPLTNLQLIDAILKLGDPEWLDAYLYAHQNSGILYDALDDQDVIELIGKFGEDWEEEIERLCEINKLQYFECIEKVLGKEIYPGKLDRLLRKNNKDDEFFNEEDLWQEYHEIQDSLDHLKLSPKDMNTILSQFTTGKGKIAADIVKLLTNNNLVPTQLPSPKSQAALPAPDNKDVMPPITVSDKDKEEVNKEQGNL